MKTGTTEKKRRTKKSVSESPREESNQNAEISGINPETDNSEINPETDNSTAPEKHINIHAEQDRIAVTNGIGSLVFWDAISGVGVADDVICMSLGKSGTFAVLDSGEVAESGVNLSRRRPMKNISGIVSASAGTGYGCLVTSDGKLITVGNTVFPEAETVSGVRSAVCGEGFLIVLFDDNRAVIIPENARESARFPIKKFKGIVGAAASDIAVLLCEDGTLRVGGCRIDDDRLDALDWRNISAVAVDSSFVYGIAPRGSVFSAGRTERRFDYGRSRVREWKNIIAIDCGSSLAAALTSRGELLTAGIFSPMTCDDKRHFEALVREVIISDCGV